MNSWTKPTSEEIDKAISLIVNVEKINYFFEKLENPNWIIPLKKRGFFDHPQKPIENKEKGTVQYPNWSQSNYLVRMANKDAEAVMTTILDIPDTENQYIHDQLAKAACIACCSRPDLVAKWAEKESQWITSHPSFRLFWCENLGKLISELSNNRQESAAFKLANFLLFISPNPKDLTTVDIKGDTLKVSPEPVLRLDIGDYKEIVCKHIPSLLVADSIKTIKMLSTLLYKSIQYSQRDPEYRGPEDYSYIWRPAIEKDEECDSHKLSNILITALRIALKHAADANTSNICSLIEILDKNRWWVFHRIKLNLLLEYKEYAERLIIESLTKTTYFEENTVSREFKRLLDKAFPNLESSVKDDVIKIIIEGPKEDRKKMWTEYLDNPTEADKCIKEWRREWLFIIKDGLPEEIKKIYNGLVKEIGPTIEREVEPFFKGGFVTHKSPIEKEELRSMSIDKIVSFIQPREPSSEFNSSSHKGLSIDLMGLVVEQSEYFSSHAENFMAIKKPTYIREIIHGFCESVKQGNRIEWEPVLKLCQWAVTQPRNFYRVDYEEIDVDPSWAWTRKETARLLTTGFKSDSFCIPITLRKNCWNILDILTNDLEPSEEYEKEYSDSNFDPMTVAINTVRGEAMIAVVEYALWIRRDIDKKPDSERMRLLENGFDEMPEVRIILDARLDKKFDPTKTIHSIYGRYYPWLMLLDSKWAAQNVKKIFPLTEKDVEYFLAAWVAYICFCPPIKNVFSLLIEQYQYAIEKIECLKDNCVFVSDPQERLVEHLVTFYWRGIIEYKDEKFFGRFYEKAQVIIKKNAINYVGMNLFNNKKALTPQTIERLIKFWTNRLQSIQNSDNKEEASEELQPFGWWFLSGAFDDSWSIDQLYNVLILTGNIEPERQVIEKLVIKAELFPKMTIDCLFKMAENNQRGWTFHGQKDNLKNILNIALSSENSQAKQRAEDLIHYLGRYSQYFWELKSLIKRKG